MSQVFTVSAIPPECPRISLEVDRRDYVGVSLDFQHEKIKITLNSLQGKFLKLSQQKLHYKFLKEFLTNFRNKLQVKLQESPGNPGILEVFRGTTTPRYVPKGTPVKVFL